MCDRLECEQCIFNGGECILQELPIWWQIEFLEKEGEQMSKADEMFKELGYIFKKEKVFGVNCVVYINQFSDRIEFDLENKGVTCETIARTSLPINIQELQAINEKVKELRWIE